MKNPQLEDGFIRIANEVWDALGHFRLSGEEWLVLNCVIRKTYGFNKKEDWISESQLVEYTGLCKQNCYRARNKLKEKNIIVIKKDYSGHIIYSFNKLFKTWKKVIKNDYSNQNRLPEVSKTITKGNQNRREQKTIDNVTKDNPPISPFKSEFVGLMQEFNSLYGKNYIITPHRLDSYKVRRVTFTAEQIRTALHNMSKDPFTKGGGDRKWTADPDYFLRNDEIIDKWLNSVPPKPDYSKMGAFSALLAMKKLEESKEQEQK